MLSARDKFSDYLKPNFKTTSKIKFIDHTREHTPLNKNSHTPTPKHSNKCVLCQQDIFQIPFIDLCWHHPVFDKKQILICNDCEFAFCEPLDSSLYDDYYQNHYKDLLGIHPYINKYLHPIKFDSKFLYNFFNSSRYLKTFKSFLEIGSGDGNAIKTLRTISDVDIYISDYNISEKFLRKYKAHKFDPKSSEQLQFFDCIYSNHTLEHVSINDLKNMLITLKTYIKKDGILVVCLPNEYHAITKMNSHSPHVNFFSPKSAARIFELAGYKVLECTTYGEEEDITNKYCPPKSIFSFVPSLTIRKAIVLLTFPIKKLRNMIKNLLSTPTESQFNCLSKHQSSNILIVAQQDL